MNRTDRLVAMVMHLQGRRVVRAEELSRHFEVSVCTVYRDISALGEAGAVRWAMLTQADVRIDSAGRATLTQAGKKLSFRVLEPADASLKIIATNPPPAATDVSNEGTRMIGFEVRVAAGAAQRLVVQLVPQPATPSEIAVQPRAQW